MDETDGPSNSSKKFNEKPEPAQRSIFDLSPESKNKRKRLQFSNAIN